MKAIALITALTTIVLVNPVWANPIPTIHVHPETGSDQTGDGSFTKPFRTITHALNRPRGQKTVIQLAQGTYSREQFPLVISGQTIVQGDSRTKGAGVVIRGGGNFRSIFGGQQNGAIVLQDRAVLRGVTVTNPNFRGFGVWIERANPTLTDSTLKQNTQDGISITGRASAIISANLLVGNGANGITIDNSATPEINRNLIDGNGFGINARQNSAPQIIANTIQNNRDGIVIQAQARPLLRHNQIINNQRTGVVVLARAIADLGTANNQGNNTFRANGEKDIHSTSSFPIAANGNHFAEPKITGNIDLTADNLAAGTGISAVPPLPNNLPPSGDGSVIVSLTGQAPPADSTIAPTLPPIASAPPEGAPVNQPIAIAPPRTIAANPLPPRFRVVVPLEHPSTLEQIRSLFPEAFASNRGGRSVVQIGAFHDQRIAIERIQQLAQIGLQAEMENIIR